MFDQKAYDELKNTWQYEDFKRVRSGRDLLKTLSRMLCTIIIVQIFNIQSPVIYWLILLMAMSSFLKSIVELVYLKPKTIFTAKITRVIEETKMTAIGATILRKYVVSDGKNEYVAEPVSSFWQGPRIKGIPIGEKVYFFELGNGKKYVVEKQGLVSVR